MEVHDVYTGPELESEQMVMVPLSAWNEFTQALKDLKEELGVIRSVVVDISDSIDGNRRI